MAKFIRADEDYSSFHSRFSVIENLVESEFHIPEPMPEDDKCVSCGAAAEIRKFVTMRKSVALVSSPAHDRVASEYRTFSLSFCTSCMTPSIPMKRKLSWLYTLGFIILLVSGSLLFFQIGTNMPNLRMFGTDGGCIMLLTAIIIWPGIVTVTAAILSRRDEKKRLAKFNKSILYQPCVVDFIDRMTKEGWQYIFDDESLYEFKLMSKMRMQIINYLQNFKGPYDVSRMTEKEYLKQLCFFEPGICTLFKGEIGIPQDVIEDYTIFDINVLGKVEADPGKTGSLDCIRCGKHTDQVNEIPLYREVLVGSEDTIRGLAREFGTVDLPFCGVCKEKEKKKTVRPWRFPWIQFIVVMLPLGGIIALMAASLTAFEQLHLFSHKSDSFQLLMMILASILACAIFTFLGIIITIWMISIWNYIADRIYALKHRRIIAALAVPARYDWSDLLPPYFRIQGFSPRLDEWLELKSLYSSIDDIGAKGQETH